MPLQPATIERVLASRRESQMDGNPVYRLKHESDIHPQYTSAALRAQVQGKLGVIVIFDASGKVHDAFVVNGGTDPWGLTDAVLQSVRRYELSEPPGQRIVGCREFVFRLR